MINSELEILMDTNTPLNIKNVKSIDTLLKLYNDSFDDLESLIEDPLLMLDTDYLIRRFEETNIKGFDDTRKELFKIHLEEIYTTFENIGESEEIYNKFKTIYEALNVPTDNLRIVAEIDKSINKEYINASSSFKSKKGTRSGFFFVYDIINKARIQSINADPFFNLIEGTTENPNEPYAYTVESSLYKEVYSKTVLPLAHPVGFTWNFSRLLLLTLKDYFGLKEHKELSKLIISCYTNNNEPISQVDVLETKVYGKLKSFNNIKSLDSKGVETEELIVDFYPLDETNQDGLRLYIATDKETILYDKELLKEVDNENLYLDIIDIKLENEQDGKLELEYIDRIFKDETYTVINSISYEEYTIIDKPTLSVLYKIKGDLDNTWYNAKFILEDKEVQEDDNKLFKAVDFSRIDIFSKSEDYNGRVEKVFPNTCQINYNINYTYKVTTTDISPYVESKRPKSNDLPRDTRDVELSKSDYDDAIANGRNPYEDLYSTEDHTVQEINFYKDLDYWARLHPELNGDIPIIGETGLNPETNQPHIEPEKVVDPITGEVTYIYDGDIVDRVIGGPWTLFTGGIKKRETGINNTTTPPRQEQYYRPSSLEDLAILKSTTPVLRYEADNLDWTTIEDSNNNIFVAWEDFNMDIYITMFKNQNYCSETPEEGDWLINQSDYYIGCPFINKVGHGTLVDAEVYKNYWTEEDEIFSIKSKSTIKDEVEITDEDSLKTIDTSEDDFSVLKMNLLIGEFDVNGEVYYPVADTNLDAMIGGIYYMYKDNIDGNNMYRYNDDTEEWEYLEDNNIEAA